MWGPEGSNSDGGWGLTPEGIPPCDPMESTPLRTVRDWISRQRFIPGDLSDEILLRFLSATEDDVQKATTMIRKYFNLRQEPSMIFRDRSPMCWKNRELFGQLYAIPLRNPLKEGEVILLTGQLNMSTTYSTLGHLKLIALTVDYLLWDRENAFSELKIILDGVNFTCPALLERLDRSWSAFLNDFQASFPVHLTRFYVLRPPEHAREIFSVHDGITLTVLKTKKEILKRFPGSVLPFEYGGTLCTLKELNDAWNLQLGKRSEFLAWFERRMIIDYRRRLLHEKEVREGGRHWVQRMKLVDDGSEFKRKYYERMANLQPTTHPAFGLARLRHKPERPRRADPLPACLVEADSSELKPSSKAIPTPTAISAPPSAKSLPEQPPVAVVEIQFCY